MVPGCMAKVSFIIATMGAMVVNDNTIPNNKSMMFCGFEK
jgi:hypothetical protein